MKQSETKYECLYKAYTITGKITSRPEVKYIVPDMNPVCSFTVFTNKKRTSNVAVFNDLALQTSRNLYEGQETCITGNVIQKTWTDRNNFKHSHVYLTAYYIMYRKNNNIQTIGYGETKLKELMT